MANWRNKIDIKDVMTASKEGTTTPAEAAITIGERLRALKLVGPGASAYQGDLEMLADNFTAWGQENKTEEDFDGVNDLLNELYDLGDTQLTSNWNGSKLIWIDHF